MDDWRVFDSFFLFFLYIFESQLCFFSFEVLSDHFWLECDLFWWFLLLWKWLRGFFWYLLLFLLFFLFAKQWPHIISYYEWGKEMKFGGRGDDLRGTSYFLYFCAIFKSQIWSFIDARILVTPLHFWILSKMLVRLGTPHSFFETRGSNARKMKFDSWVIILLMRKRPTKKTPIKE